ncbi:GGDEF domain-containing protein [Sporosarcina sp. E16_8]|uniref:GGDEF domain-containing protein n=1 Tax=Sporosarcina sp. E16_8 TaxID=2789295 RepID=UPI001A91878C|nr:GGDEF domain-containing protein [Sporosarcina sp. E16_8]MBO0587090.1 GGDEF domain-containing protein [Sporosarcina sp. E16_8]
MQTQQLGIYLLVYMVPAFVIFGIGCMVLAQSPRRLEHKLMVAFSFTYCLLFLEEFIRHLLPLSSSAWMVGMFFYQIRLLTSAILFHFFIHTTKMYERFRILFYPYLFYVPVVIVIILTVMNVNVVDNTEFIQNGIWYSQIFSKSYYMKLILSNVILILMVATLWNGMKHATSFRKRKSIQVLMVGMISMLILTVILGYPNYGRFLPPYPYLLSGIVFTGFLSISVLRFQLLPSVTRRYKELFNLSPVSIIITNDQWEVLEYNNNAAIELGPQVREGFIFIDYFKVTTNRQQLLRLSEQLEKEVTIRDYPIKIMNTAQDEYLYFSLDASLLKVDEDVFYYLICRNVTEELESKQLVQHLAYHDALTTIYNRAFFVAEVEGRLKLCPLSQRMGQRLCSLI